MATTIERARENAKRDKLQAHWEVPGHVATVYNIANHTQYRVSLLAGFWHCECKWAQYGSGPCKHIARVVDKVRAEQAR